MSQTSPRPYILVGVDGSTSALHALSWATEEAGLRNLPLRLAHAADLGSFAMGFDPGTPQIFFDNLDSAAQGFLVQAQSHVQQQDSNVEVSTVKVSGRPVPALRELSRGALLTVLGSSGLNAVTGALAGSVSVALSAHGHSPVVVVRTPGRPVDAPVVVGVSGEPESLAAVGWAFEEASLRGADLIAIHIWKYLPANYVYNFDSWDDAHVVPESEHELLAERLAGWQEQFPDVTVRRIVTAGSPGEILLSHAQHAQLIVTGSRGRGDVAGLFLGSTSHALIHRATCPVLVARPGQDLG